MLTPVKRLLRGVERVVRRRSARWFLVALKRATHRMPSTLEEPTKGRVLVIAPHADDEVIPCGGTLLRHRALGSSVCVIFVTDSAGAISDPDEAQRLRTRRLEESTRVARAMGFEALVRLDFPDGSLVRYEDELTIQLVEQINAFQPDIIYSPFPGDSHGDHQACALAVADAAVLAGWKGNIHAYEVWNALWPNTMVDISQQATEKADLIALYASQMEDRDYAQGVLGLNRFRGMQHRVSFAEAFYVCRPSEYLALARTLNQFVPQVPDNTP